MGLMEGDDERSPRFDEEEDEDEGGGEDDEEEGEMMEDEDDTKLELRSFLPSDEDVDVVRRSEPEGGGGRGGLSARTAAEGREEEEEEGDNVADEALDVFELFLELLDLGEIRSRTPFLVTI